MLLAVVVTMVGGGWWIVVGEGHPLLRRLQSRSRPKAGFGFSRTVQSNVKKLVKEICKCFLKKENSRVSENK